MATKKIVDLTQVQSAVDSDLLIIETSNGTKAINKGNLIPKELSSFTDDSTHRLVTDAEKSSWNAKQNQIKRGTITLTASNWGFDPANNWYWQDVAISNSTANSKIDLQPEATVLNQLIDDGVVAIYISNYDGILVAYAIGEKPTADLTVQFTMMEVG